MATKNCPKCDSPNPVACKKCACGHVFFATRRSANTVTVEANDDISEPTTPQEPELPRRRTARVTRERPQFYDALQVENQTRRQRELQKRRKASKSDEAEAVAEEVPEKSSIAPTSSKRARAESPPAKVVEPAPKKRRGRPPGLTNRRSGRAQILASKPSDPSKAIDAHDGNMDGEVENVAGMHDVPPLKALQMNMVLADINTRISSSSVRAETNAPNMDEASLAETAETNQGETKEEAPQPKEDKMEGKPLSEKESKDAVAIKEEPDAMEVSEDDAKTKCESGIESGDGSPKNTVDEMEAPAESIKKDEPDACDGREPDAKVQTAEENTTPAKIETPEKVSEEKEKIEVKSEAKEDPKDDSKNDGDSDAKSKEPMEKDTEAVPEPAAAAAQEEADNGEQAVSSTSSKGCAFPC